MDTTQQVFWRQFWDESASILVDQRSLTLKLQKQGGRILSSLDLRGNRLLDVGCGFGFIDQYLLAHSAVDITGVDFQAHLIQRTDTNGRFHRVSGDGLHLPFASASFDIVLVVKTLHHLRHSDRGSVVAEMCRVLKPGGE